MCKKKKIPHEYVQIVLHMHCVSESKRHSDENWILEHNVH